MPSAPAELITVNETGWASRLASAASDCAAIAWMLQAEVGAGERKQPGGQPGPRRVEQLHAALWTRKLRTEARTMRT